LITWSSTKRHNWVSCATRYSPGAGNYETTSPSTKRPTWHSPKQCTPPCSPATAGSPEPPDPSAPSRSSRPRP